MKLLAIVLLGWAAPAAALQHTVVKGDHLWGLAGTYYGGNHFRWQAIYAANRDKIKDPHWIYPGQVFEIPEVPNAAIGELPARPVEAAPVVQAPPPEEPVAQEAPAPKAQAPAPPMQAAPYQGVVQDLSSEAPEGQVPGYPSVSRVVEPKSWSEDGTITAFDGGREALAGVGDWVIGKAKAAREGDAFTVYRRSAPGTLDTDAKGKTYLVVIGEVVAKSPVSKGKWRLLVTKSGDTVQPGDLLKLNGAR